MKSSISGKTNAPAPKNIKAVLTSGAATCLGVLTNGSMYGQNKQIASVPRTATNVTATMANGAWSRCRLSPGQLSLAKKETIAANICFSLGIQPAKLHRRIGIVIDWPDGISMFSFISAMIHIEPATTTKTMSTPKASARTLLVLSGPLVMCRKNTR